MDNRNPSRKAVKAKKHLGQHFLTDLNIAAKIAGAVTGGTAANPVAVLEVGCGTGVLTRFLVERPDIILYGAEVDSESVAYLQENYPEFASGRLYHEDFLKMDIKGLFAGYPSLSIAGNFPYNISSQIFFKVVENRDFIPEVVGMMQKEVAQRIAEPPGSRLYGITSVILQAWYDIEYLFTVNENVFNPQPKVKSAVIRLRRNDTATLGCNEELFVKVVKAAFGQRRKMVRNALRSVFGNFSGQEHRFFNERAERLGVKEFVKLTYWVESAIKV